MTQTIKTNERELSGKIAEWLNQHIQRNSHLPFTEATNETGIKTESSTRFGDIVLWKNRETREALSLIELKPPFGEKENLNNLKQKAQSLSVKYVFTWNFQNLNTYEVKGSKLELILSDPNPVLKTIDEWVRRDKQADIKTIIHRFCNDLEILLESGKTHVFRPEKIYFVQLIRKYVEQLIPKFESFIQQEYRKTKNKSIITEYAVKQGIAFPNESDYIHLITRQHVYGLVTKIIFYLTIKRYFHDLPDLLQRDSEDLNYCFKLAFQKAAEKDWQSVFKNSPIEDLGIPESVYDDFDEFFSHLKVYHFGQLPEDVLSEMFEEIIDPDQRHSLGQYFTPETLVDFVIGFVANDQDGYYGDPTCGSGTFLIRLYDRLKFLSAGKKRHQDILNQIWGFDIAKFPAELSTINLFRQEVQNFENFPKVVCSDVFYIQKGQTFQFPPPNAGLNYVKVNIPLPEFDGFVGNFPFIRQELIEKKIKG